MNIILHVMLTTCIHLHFSDISKIMMEMESCWDMCPMCPGQPSSLWSAPWFIKTLPTNQKSHRELIRSDAIVSWKAMVGEEPKIFFHH